MTKVCTKCGIEKDVIEYDKDKHAKSLYRSMCKTCRHIMRKSASSMAYHKEYYKKNREKLLQMSAAWNEEHRDEISIRKKEYREYNKEKIQENERKRRERDREKRREVAREPKNIARAFFIRHNVLQAPNELIDIKAQQIRLFRAVRDKRLEEK